jgi:predicted aldo/keto reductase-like oxidoreductase
MPCEQGVQIPKVLLIKSQMLRFTPKQLALMAKESVASVEQCADCGECVDKCPYHLPVPDMLKEYAETFKRFLTEHGFTT